MCYGHKYRIRVQGHLGEHWAVWFDGLSVTRGDNGETILSGSLPDQAAPHGVVAKVRDLGLPLIAISRQPASAEWVVEKVIDKERGNGEDI